jgi:hypothetical protein
LTVLTERDVWINSLHLVCGALVLATSVVITLRAWRVKFADRLAAGMKNAAEGDVVRGAGFPRELEAPADRRAAGGRVPGSGSLQPDRGSRA